MVKAQPTRPDIDFGVLGPLVASVDGTAIRFTGAKERCLLAFLLLHANEMVSIDRLIDALWPDDPPMTARNTLQVHVSRLRKAVGSSRLATFANGYSLTVRPGELDLFRFRELAGEGRRARAEEDAAGAAESLREALSLWRGQPLPELSENPVFAVESSRLAEEHLAAFEERIEAELDSGEGTSLVAELEDAASKNPLRERLMGQLMVALYRAGRQAEALDMYTRTRHRLVAELGLEPGPMLADLHQRILAHDPGLIRERRERSPLPPPSRRNVTVVLALLPVSADADPEVAERELEDTRQQARTVLEEQGALVSGAGNVIVGTFGLPATNEDDPQRAVRAAAELAKTGVRVSMDSGVALVLDTELTDSRFVSRLRDLVDLGEAGDVVVGAGGQRALGSAVQVSGSRLVSFDPATESIARRLDAPLIGREREFERLRESFQWTTATRSAHLVTILGAAGIGKSRLARELVASVSEDATVLTGRCLAYGSGAFWPLGEMVKQAAGDTTPEALLSVSEDLDDRSTVIDQLAAALGTGTGMRAEDAFWAFRKFFDALALERPLVLLFEDLHWGEGRLLDFIEELVDRNEGAAILVLCLARPDLLEKRPAWGGGKLDAETIQLTPMSEASSHELIRILGEAVSNEAQGQIAARAEGNPLFIEQLVALSLEDPKAPSDAIPPSIHAVLSARVDRLARVERECLERASIVGLEFCTADVAALSGEATSDGQSGLIAERLVAKDLLRPVGPDLGGVKNYRFRHILIRDVVYGTILKSTRAELHERFARWLEQDLQQRASEIDEIIGYHLEQSYELRKELHPEAEELQQLAEEAGERLVAAGKGQYDRSDMPAAIDFLERARVLLSPDSRYRPEALEALTSVYRLTGQWVKARDCLDQALVLAEQQGNLKLAAWLRTSELQLRLFTDELEPDEFVRLASALLAGLQGSESVYSARVKSAVAWAYALAGQCQLAERLINEVVDSELHPADPRKLLPSLWLNGPLPAQEAIARCENVLRSKPPPRTAASCYRALAVLFAARGEFDEAHSLCDLNQSILQELGLRVMAAASTGIRATVYSFAGRLDEAERELRNGMSALRNLGETLHSTGLEAQLARTLMERGDYAEARRVFGSDESSATDDIAYRVDSLGVRARLAAVDGRHKEARLLVAEAVSLADRTDSPDLQGAARLDLGHVLRIASDLDGSRTAFSQAVDLFEQKGNVIETRETRALVRD